MKNPLRYKGRENPLTSDLSETTSQLIATLSKAMSVWPLVVTLVTCVLGTGVNIYIVYQIIAAKHRHTVFDIGKSFRAKRAPVIDILN